ncbi:hypothetical protein Sxan_23760 [Streptomyces xanthophaeus]|uniref:Uncharacterized protein n=1 Tax=Streptomyces xanthophaeus TaxID=67385 RepID=A0A919GX96_9ACTN|nr:hypothetical protein Sxan_23760 [Streptomyces xanthophaeus]
MAEIEVLGPEADWQRSAPTFQMIGIQGIPELLPPLAAQGGGIPSSRGETGPSASSPPGWPASGRSIGWSARAG